MNTRLIISLLLFVSLFIETSLVAFPFIFILSVITYILFPDLKTFMTVFLIGLGLDILKASPVGATPLVIFSSFSLLDLVRRVFELKDYKIIILILFIMSLIYSKVFSYTDNLLIYILLFGGSLGFISYFYKKSLW